MSDYFQDLNIRVAFTQQALLIINQTVASFSNKLAGQAHKDDKTNLDIVL